MSRADRRRPRLGRSLAAGVALIGICSGLSGCGGSADGTSVTSEAGVSSTSPTPTPATATATATTTPAESSGPVREGHDARPDLAFEPATIELPGGRSAPVRPASTVNGVLAVPEHVSTVGWWDGSAQIGDPFGSTVIAGHIDSATEGLGFFARLLSLKKGQHVTVRGFAVTDPKNATTRHATYRITSSTLVAKDALAADSDAFDQTTAPRLVLITCGGAYLPSKGGYQSNVVIIAEPV